MPNRDSRDSDGSVTLSRIDASRCRPLALRSSVTRAMPSRRASRGDATTTGAPLDPDRAAAAPVAGAEQRLEDLGAPGAEQAARSRAPPRPGHRSRRRRARAASPAATARRARAAVPRAPPRHPAPRTSQRPPRSRRPTIAAIMRSRSISSIGAVTTLRPSRSTVTRSASARDLVEPVRDVDDADAVGRELPDDAEEPRAFRRRQRRGRLVHDEDARVERQRLGDLDELLLADAQPGDPRLRVELDPEPLEQAPRRPRPCVRRSRISPASSGSRPRKMFAATPSSGHEVRAPGG